MKTITLYQPTSIHALHTTPKAVLFLTLACSVAFFGLVFPAQADIYKWHDAAGVIYYSNHPPADLSRMIEIIPSQNEATESGGEPKVYYFSTPDGQSNESFTVPPDVLQELFGEQSQAAAAPILPVGDSPDLTALTMRLADIEKTLHQEVETRVQWQQQYAQAQSEINTLEQQNRTLNIALAEMENDLDFLRGTVVASDMEVTALKQRVQPGQYVMLANTVTGLQEQVHTVALELESLDALALSQKVAMLAGDILAMKIQQQPDYQLHLRLASLESDLQHIADTQSDSQAVATLARLEENGQALQGISADHAQRLTGQQTQIAALQAELESLKTAQTPAEKPNQARDTESPALVARLIENNQRMEAMLNQQSQALQAQEAQLNAIQTQAPAPERLTSAAFPSSGIRIIPRIERRRTSLLARFATWLETPQPQMEE